ncbi:MAG: hypothetical protein PWP70_37 [Moorella sp. (in: firmicutes)]|nr:hypothetical protein [Moorella sp. (in: firmicutes)]
MQYSKKILPFLLVLLLLWLAAAIPVLAAGQYAAADTQPWRIVLTVNGQPHDADAHLLVPGEGPGSYGNYHLSWQQTGNGTLYPYAYLSGDSIQEGGREEIVLNRLLAGTYKYAVNNFSMEKDWSRADATVQVYRGDQLLATYNLHDAQGDKGSWWHVFKIENGALVPLNVIDPAPIDVDPSNITVPSFSLEPAGMAEGSETPFNLSFNLAGTGIAYTAATADLVFKYAANNQEVLTLPAARQADGSYQASLQVALGRGEYLVELYPSGSHSGLPRGRTRFTVTEPQPKAPEASRVVVTPANPTVTTGGSVDFSVKVYDANGGEIQSQLQPAWSASAGSIDSSGHFVAPDTPQEVTVTATVPVSAEQNNPEGKTVSGTAKVKVVAPSNLPVLEFNPAETSVGVGAETQVALHINAIDAFQGADLTVQFDPAVVEVTRVMPAGVKDIKLDASIDNTGGTITFVGSNYQAADYPQGVDVLTFYLRGKAAGESPLTVSSHQLSGPQGRLLEHEVRTGLVRVTPAGNLSGTLNLGGGDINLDNLRQGMKALVDGQPVSIDVDQSGHFTLGSVPAGQHALVVWRPGFLKKKVFITVSGGQVNVAGDLILQGGDVNEDNTVDIRDLTALAGAFRAQTGQGSFLPAADFNGDGVIDLRDLTALAGSYRMKGDE